MNRYYKTACLILMGAVFLFFGLGILAQEEGGNNSDNTDVKTEERTPTEDESGEEDEAGEELKGKQDISESGLDDIEQLKGLSDDTAEEIVAPMSALMSAPMEEEEEASEDEQENDVPTNGSFILENTDKNPLVPCPSCFAIEAGVAPSEKGEGAAEKQEEEIDSGEESASDKIVINEIAWMGTVDSSSEEWMELYNDGDEDVSLTGWILKTEDGGIEIELEGKIKAGEYFLLERTDDTTLPEEEADQIYTGSLSNSGEKIILLDNNGEVIDELDVSSGWLAGDNESKKTMERAGDGWQTSFVVGGTPKKENSKDSDENTGENDSDDEGPIIYSEKVRINELLPNPSGDEEAGEWIEIYCFDPAGIDLKDWSLEDAGGKSYKFNDKLISVGEHLVIGRTESKIALNNSNESLFLKNPTGGIMDEISYDSSQEDYSYAINTEGLFKWAEITTPGEENKFPEKKVYPRGIFFNEVMSNPDGSDEDAEWVEVFNSNNFEINLTGWKIFNQAGKYFKIGLMSIEPKVLAVIEIINSSFYLRNSDEVLMLVNPNDEEADKIELLGSASQGSSFNKSSDGDWSWSRFATPGKENRINHLPKIKIKKPDEVYKDMKAEFDAGGTSDADKDDLKFRWDFGDNHRSYLEKTSHTYEENGKYLVSLRVDDGSTQVFEEFWVEVEDFPQYDLTIVRLLPNPVGADTGNEEVEIKNNESKEINLKNWKIATGSSEEKLVNHPIYEDLFIDEDETITIKNIDCHFALNNKAGVVVLRYPNDEEADKVEYEKNKIADDEEYVLTEDGWIWRGGVAEEVASAESVAVLGQTSILNARFFTQRSADLWQKIMSDDENLRTLTMRGLMITNWLCRDWAWRMLGV